MAPEVHSLPTEYEQRARRGASDERRASGASTHKLRSAWFRAREGWPLREAPIELLTVERARVAAQLPAAPGADQWTPVGPANIGGRMTCAVSDPAAPERLWAGAAGGGIWRSNDMGATWRPLWHSQASLNVGAIALDPQNPAILYVGTGEANLSADSHPGVGVFRSQDRGESWQLHAEAGATGLPRRIGSLAVDPHDSDHLVVGGVAHLTGEASGLFSSSDGGVTWARRPLIGDSFYRCHDVRFHPTRPGVVFATISALGMAERGLAVGRQRRYLGSARPGPPVARPHRPHLLGARAVRPRGPVCADRSQGRRPRGVPQRRWRGLLDHRLGRPLRR